MDAETEKIRRAERAMDEAFAAICRAFRQVDLTEGEKAYVRDAGQKLNEQAFNLLVDRPDSGSLRPFVIAFALAAIVGPVWNNVDDITDACDRASGFNNPGPNP